MDQGKYELSALDIGKLVDRKQAEYGDSHGKSGQILKVLYPKGIPCDSGALTVIRVIDKLFRIANGNQGNEDAWRDIAGYSLLMIGKTTEPYVQSSCYCEECKQVKSSDTPYRYSEG